MSEKIPTVREDNEPEHIQESTLIPESGYIMMDDPNDEVAVVPESNAGTAEQVEKPMAAAILEKEPSFLKKNGGYIAVAGFATVLFLGFAFNRAGPSQPQVAQTPATVVQQPVPQQAVEKSATPAVVASAAPVSTPVEISNASVPGSPAAMETPTAVVTLSSQPAVATTTAPITTNAVMPSEVTATPVAVVTVTPAAPMVDMAKIDSQISNNGTVVDLQTRVKNLENDRLKSVAPVATSSSETTVAKETKKPVILSAAQRARQRDAAMARQATRVAGNNKNAASRATAATYSVHIVRDNLAWLRAPDGTVSSYSLGDSIPGLGKLSKINEHNHTIVAGNLTIK